MIIQTFGHTFFHVEQLIQKKNLFLGLILCLSIASVITLKLTTSNKKLKFAWPNADYS